MHLFFFGFLPTNLDYVVEGRCHLAVATRPVAALGAVVRTRAGANLLVARGEAAKAALAMLALREKFA